ncbi:MAG: prepilin-type cleavage/methylation domain-containing protein [Lysobacteraceae bacterium]|nr:MAG: prepilin-type cleavage/methylation domain-containing protein [Xanthomonadaceae bacterium]
MKRTRGFTLIELMIVVAIIAILAAISLFAYQDSVARAQVAEGLGLATGAKTAITIYHAENNQFPVDNVDAGLAGPTSINGRYVRSVTVTGTGGIDVLFSGSANAKIAGQTLMLAPIEQGGSLSWVCSGHDARYLPSSCR